MYLTENYKDGIFVNEIREKIEIDSTSKIKEYNEFPALKLNGKHTLYNKNKQITKDGIYKDNQFIEGKAYFYDENGVLTRIAVYKNGIFVGNMPKEK